MITKEMAKRYAAELEELMTSIGKNDAAGYCSTGNKKTGTLHKNQTGEIGWTAMKRTHDGLYQAIADEGENAFTPEKGATFLASVYKPTFTSP